MVLLGDIGQQEAHFGPFGDSVNLDTRMVHLGNVGQVEAHFGPFRDSVNLGAR
jgi:class 3 adenylate cyclase